MFESALKFATGTFVALLPITDPLGAVPLFYTLTSGAGESHRLRQARWTSLHVIWVLALFLLAGKLILATLGISLAVLRIAGGLLVANAGWQMVRADHGDHGAQTASPDADIAFAPMAMPLVSGPGAIGAVIGLSAQTGGWYDYVGSLVGIALLGALVYLCLRWGAPILAALGSSGLKAFNQVIGFLTVALAIQLIVDGSLDLLTAALPGAHGG